MALALASALLVLLAFQNRVLDREVRDLRIRGMVPHAGSFVPAFETSTSSGHRALIGQALPGTRQILLILNTTCEFCEATLPAWMEIAGAFDAADASPAEVYAITLDPPELTAAYAADHGFAVPWVTFRTGERASSIAPGGCPSRWWWMNTEKCITRGSA